MFKKRWNMEHAYGTWMRSISLSLNVLATFFERCKDIIIERNEKAAEEEEET